MKRFVYLATLLSAAASTAFAAITITVNTTSDGIDATPGDGVCETVRGNGVCTFRAAIQEVNALPGTDKVALPAGRYVLDFTIATPRVDILDAVTISGSGASSTIMEPDFGTRPANQLTFPMINVPNINSLGNPTRDPVRISALTLRGGRSTVVNAAAGAALVNRNDLFLDAVVLEDNHNAYAGGAIDNWGTLTITNSTLRNNDAPAGGAISNIAVLNVTNTLFVNNSAQAGGGIWTYNCQVCSRYGPGIVNIKNTTFSNNTATNTGGAIVAQESAQVSLVNATFDGNSAGLGGSLGVSLGGPGTPTFRLENTILSNPVSGTNCGPGAQYTSQGHNISSDTSCGFNAAGDKNNTDPLLAPLADNGGPTLTHALLGRSPAIDSGSESCLAFDQRAVSRPIDADEDGVGSCDVGAYETSPLTAGFTIPSLNPIEGGAPGNTTVTIRGNGFAGVDRVELLSSSNVVAAASKLSVESQGRLRVTFDL